MDRRGVNLCGRGVAKVRTADIVAVEELGVTAIKASKGSGSSIFKIWNWKMIQTNLQLGLGLGFLATWVGFLCLFFAVARPNFSIRRMKENNLLPLGEKMGRANDDLLSGSKSRLGRIGQLLLAIGLSALTLTGMIWFALQIIGTQSVPS
jgi:hypothetical protein